MIFRDNIKIHMQNNPINEWRNSTPEMLILTYAPRQLMKFLMVSWPKYRRRRPLSLDLSWMKKLVPEPFHDMMESVFGSSIISKALLKKRDSFSLNAFSLSSFGFRNGSIVEEEKLTLPLFRATDSSCSSCSINWGMNLGLVDDSAKKVSIFCCLLSVACRHSVRKAKPLCMFSRCCLIVLISIPSDVVSLLSFSSSVSISLFSGLKSRQVFYLLIMVFLFTNLYTTVIGFVTINTVAYRDKACLMVQTSGLGV